MLAHGVGVDGAHVHAHRRQLGRPLGPSSSKNAPGLTPLLHRPAGLLSGGQRQQLAMARTLVARPRLLLLDEPTEGIRPSIIVEIQRAIGALHRARGLTILLGEQYLAFALRLADRYEVMVAGRVSAAGATAEPEELHRLLAV